MRWRATHALRAPPSGTPERHDFTYWLHRTGGAAMPPQLPFRVALRIARTPLPCFARPPACISSAAPPRR
ncbi:hypothetical protein BLAT2472_40323 [Burkholderia latens]|nr:hypothetical protein WK25_21875 [Burkholderia latens]